MVELQELVSFTDDLLEVERFRDYCPNGLQVEGRPEIRRLVTGVTACQPLLDAALAVGADAILVHHGYFWRGEDVTLTGIRRRRLKTLLEHDISLLAYHLPLDAHPLYGNNVQLAARLGFEVAGRFGPEQPAIGLHGRLPAPLKGEALAQHLREVLEQTPLHITADRPIRTLAWCSGAAQGYIEDAIRLGVDAYLTGEASEQTVHVARENGIHFFAAGHHATERYGVQALGDHLAAQFGLEQEFIDVPNPV
jgi:dinuclear metal center YbgI/SA1388 family protein